MKESRDVTHAYRVTLKGLSGDGRKVSPRFTVDALSPMLAVATAAMSHGPYKWTLVHLTGFEVEEIEGVTE